VRATREFLQLLTEAYPVEGGGSHCLEPEGGKLVLWLRAEIRLCGQRVPGLPLSFSEADLDQGPAELVAEVGRALERLGYEGAAS
jgi:hypothetical protein